MLERFAFVPPRLSLAVDLKSLSILGLLARLRGSVAFYDAFSERLTMFLIVSSSKYRFSGYVVLANVSGPLTYPNEGVTRGTWRGLNQIYNFSIPSGTLVAGTNTITINVISGSSGDGFLSPNFVFDSVELF